MKKGTSLKLILIAVIGIAAGIGLSVLFKGNLFALIGTVAVTLIACGSVMYFNSTGSISKSERLKDTRDYRNALLAWLREGTPFNDIIRIAINHLDSLDRKQKALRSILDDSKDSPFLATADEVEHYVLSNTKRLLNRIMIFDGTNRNRLESHMNYLRKLLQDNVKVLTEFENLIVEISQIGDDAQSDMPVLKELTDALHSFRDNGDEDVWEQLDAQSQAEVPLPLTENMSNLQQLRAQPQYFQQQAAPAQQTLPPQMQSTEQQNDNFQQQQMM